MIIHDKARLDTLIEIHGTGDGIADDQAGDVATEYHEAMMREHLQRMDRLGATTATLLKELAEKDARIAELEAEAGNAQNLAIFLAGAWHGADNWIWEHAAHLEAVDKYPMMQGTANINRIKRIGWQHCDRAKAGKAIARLLSDESLSNPVGPFGISSRVTHAYRRGFDDAMAQVEAPEKRIPSLGQLPDRGDTPVLACYDWRYSEDDTLLSNRIFMDLCYEDGEWFEAEDEDANERDAPDWWIPMPREQAQEAEQP